MNLAFLTRAASLLVVTALVSACPVEPPDPDAFYSQGDAAMPENAGGILKSEPFHGAPKGANAWKVLYRSTGLDGKPIVVSGVIMAPDGPPPEGGRPIVAWAHPTTGVARRCAPSLTREFTFKRTPGMEDFLKRGYVVAATDYPGLGTTGAHPYLVGISEGRAVLDSVRAAADLADAGAGKTFAVWGHSQGGHAALYTGELAASYAPDLKLAGIAAAAPATELAMLFHDDLGSEKGKMLTSFALWSWNRVYDASLQPLLSSESEETVDAIAADCIEGPLEVAREGKLGKSLSDGFLKEDITKIEPWKSLLAENTPGKRPAGGPVYIAQGSADDVVRPEITIGYVEKLCARGVSVEFDWHEDVGHIPMGFDAAPAVAEWIAARFRGDAPPNNCKNVSSITASN